jgi:phosphopantetheinyl transferase
MFHGPVFQSVAMISRYGADGIDATLQVPADTGILTPDRYPGLCTDPVLLDGAIQAVGFWAWDQLERGFAIFPIGFDALDIYGSFPPPCTAVACAARIRLLRDGRISSDIDLVGAGRAILARLTGWQYRRFDWTRRFTEFGLAPQRGMLSSPWPAPVSRLPDGARCCRIHHAEIGGGSWLPMLASLILNRQERTAWSQVAGSEAQQQAWLLGRLVAKDAVRLFLGDNHGVQLAAADVEIVVGEHGRPHVVESLERQLGIEVDLSISHSGGNAVAVAASRDGRGGIGIDIECLGNGHRVLADVGVSPDERALLAELPAGEPSAWLLRLRCAKEATTKALGAGLGWTSHNLVVRKADPTSGAVWLEGAENLVSGQTTELIAQTACADGLVFALSMAREGGADGQQARNHAPTRSGCGHA